MQTAVIHFDSEPKVQKMATASEQKGSLASQNEEDKLMRSVLNNDKEKIKEGKIVKEALNMGISSFTPDLLFEQLVKNFSMTNKTLGPTLLRELTNYSSSYVEKNIRIPEFQKEVKKNIKKNLEKLEDEGLIDKNGAISERGMDLASLLLYTEELDKLIPKGILGEKIHKKRLDYGDREDISPYKKGDRYRDIAIQKSIKLGILGLLLLFHRF
jgi:hypothetical protein